MPPTPTLPPAEQKLVVYEQQLLYDRRRGAESGAIMLHRQVVIVNHTNQSQRLHIAAPVDQATVDYGLDYLTGFSIFRDLIKEPGFSLPPDELIQTLPQPAVQPQNNGQSLAIWNTVEVAPGHAVLAGFSSLWGKPENLYQGQSIVLPGLRIDPTAQLDSNRLMLSYNLQALDQAANGIRFSVFLPTTVSPGPAAPPDITLYKVVNASSSPPAQTQAGMFQVDGHLNLAQGTTYLFRLDSIAQGSSQIISIEATIERSGKAGHAIPYLTVIYYHHNPVVPAFQVQPESPVPVTALSPVFISNVGLPDLNDLGF
jgi:hypothetical protein